METADDKNIHTVTLNSLRRGLMRTVDENQVQGGETKKRNESHSAVPLRIMHVIRGSLTLFGAVKEDDRGQVTDP